MNLFNWFRGTPPPEPVGQQPQRAPNNLFDALLQQQTEKPRSTLRGPQGEVYDPFERSPLDPRSH